MSRSYNGYPIEHITDAAYTILQSAADAEFPKDLFILGLCRAISMIGSHEDLDAACYFIDQFSDLDRGTE